MLEPIINCETWWKAWPLAQYPVGFLSKPSNQIINVFVMKENHLL
jgi:hypothetical protein